MSADTGSVTIVEFLNARYDEAAQMAEDAADGGVGQWAAGTHPADECRIGGDQIIIYDEGGHTPEQARFIAANDPAFVLADIAAKRRLIELAIELDRMCDAEWGEGADPLLILWPQDRGYDGLRIVKQLALPFADRPGYDETWRP